MKKLFSLICVAVLLMGCIVSVSADVIFEPMDSFYESHRDDCQRHERSYTAFGPNGDVTVYESPESDEVKATYANGEVLYISYIYTDPDGIQWGYYENWETGVSGWVPMDYLELIYDGISFEEEFGHLFSEEEGTLAAEHQGKLVKFWKYPGSTEYLEWAVEGENMPAYQTVYTDSNGVRWGREGYYMGLRGYWINLDAPDADFVPTESAVPEETKPQEQTDPVEEIKPAQPEGLRTATLLIVIAVVAVVAVTAVVLVLLKRKN